MKAKTVRLMATPAQTAIHGARTMKTRPDALSMRPQDGYGGGTPNPKKLKEASAKMMEPSETVAVIIMGAITLGRM